MRPLLTYFVWAFYKIWTSTWRTELIESPDMKRLRSENKNWIFGMWHGDELAIVHFTNVYKIATMTSTSKDGALMDGVLNLLGAKTSRGSSTRGGARALVGLIRLGKTGRIPVFAVDGPKGPLHKAKPGIFELAKHMQLPIIPAGVATSRTYVFKKSWNRAHLPLPFSKVVLYWGETLSPELIDDPRDPKLAEQLEKRIHDASQLASKKIAGND